MDRPILFAGGARRSAAGWALAGMVVLWFLFACGVAAAEAWIAVRIYLEYGNVGLFAMFLANMTLVPILSDVIKAWRGNRRGY